MDTPENVLEVALPKKRIRIAFNNWFCTGLVSVYMTVCGGLGIALLVFYVWDIFEGRWPSAFEKRLFSFETWFFLVMPFLMTWAFYFLAKQLFSRILPGRIQIVGVEVVESYDARALVGLLGRAYWFKGAAVARVLSVLPFTALPVSAGLRKDPVQKLNHSRFKQKNHRILWLDEKKQIALAAENLTGGGAMLLDEDLTHLRWISREDRQKLLASLREVQRAVDKDPRRLRKIIRGIKAVEWENYSGKKRTGLPRKDREKPQAK